MVLGLGLGFTRQQVLRAQGLTDLSAYAAGDSTEEYHFTQYSGAGESSFETEAATHYEGSVDFVDAARSGSFLLESTALATDPLNTNLFWVDDSGVLADGAQLTNNVVNIAGTADIYTLSLGINDHSQTGGLGLTAADYEAGYDYLVTRIGDEHACSTMINTLSRDTSGNDDGANAVMQGMLDALTSNGKALRGIDVYDLALADAKHHTQAAQEIKAEREAKQVAFYTGNSTEQALGSKITSAVLKTDVIELSLQHVGGSDITAPVSGAGGFEATDDGSVMGATGLIRADSTTMHLTFPEGKAPVDGSVVTLYAPYGANGNGLNGAAPDVAKDNSALSLPIQRDIVSVTQGDPVQDLDNLVIYIDARGSVKTMPGGTDAEQVYALAGSVSSMAEIDAGDHFVWDAAGFGGVGALQYQDVSQMHYGSFAAGATHTFGFVLEMPDPLDSGDLMFFANAGGSTDNQAKLGTAGDRRIYWSLSETNNSVAISDPMVAGQQLVMVMEFVDNDVLNVYIDDMSTPFATLNPRNDFSGWDHILLGARTINSENGGYPGLNLGAYFHTTDVLSLSEKQAIAAYWTDRFGL